MRITSTYQCIRPEAGRMRLARYRIMRAMQTLLFGVSAGDPITFAVVLGMLATVADIACAIPAIRAARVDPMLVLRDQERLSEVREDS